MNAEDFKLSLVDRAIEIVSNAELSHAYSCFAIEQAVKEAFDGDEFSCIREQYKHSDLYCAFAKDYFIKLPTSSVVRREGDSMPFWWSTDYAANRYIPERVEFLGVFRNWLVEQGAQ
jgi:hypothetical protein